MTPLAAAVAGRRLSAAQAHALAALPAQADAELCAAACALRARSAVSTITYSPKVFIALTRLCRDACAYCTYKLEPGADAPFLEPDAVLALARAGERLGCREALFVLGERPEQRYPQARAWLAARGYASSIAYLRAMCALVLERTSLLPHSNAGLLSEHDVAALRDVNVSLGLMLETTSLEVARSGAHAAAPSKHPRARLATIARAGRARVALTTGILIGIGEMWTDRVDALLAIRTAHERYGHIQEAIVQNFRAHAGTPMAAFAEPEPAVIVRAAALARLILGPAVHVQVPPNLAHGDYGAYLDAGIDDWGGISPLTRDEVNPEHAWPALREVERVTHARGFTLRPRDPVYPEFATARFLAPGLLERTQRYRRAG